LDRKFKYLVLLILALATVSIHSCKETESSETDYNPNVLSSKDYIRAEDAMYEVVNAFFKGVYDSVVIQDGYRYIDYCDVSYKPALNVLEFGYGTTNRWCEDEKFRRGGFKASLSGEPFEEGVVAHIVTDSLFVDDFLVEIVADIENLGLNEQSKISYSLKIDSTDIFIPDTTKFTGVSLSSDFIMTWDQGSSTPQAHEDDVFLVTGTASGISTNGYLFSVAIQDPLINMLDCYWISEGLTAITVPSGQVTSGDIDYVTEDGCFNQFYFYFDSSTFYDQIK
jgi:hypothetical protein